MTAGVLKPHLSEIVPKTWDMCMLKGSATLVVDSAPNARDKQTIQLIGHADKIRMQVRHISSDGKVYIDSDSFLPLTLIGNRVSVFTRRASDAANVRVEGATVEAIGAIHFADAETRSGSKGIKKKDLYLDFHVDSKKKLLERLDLRVGDPVLLNRPIERTLGKDTFSGAYLDNGLGCFAVAELARRVAERESDFSNLRLLFTFVTHEEIGRFGSRVAASVYKPDVLIALDVNHDYEGAPGVSDRRFPTLKMGRGCTISNGCITSNALTSMMVAAAKQEPQIPYQLDVDGSDTGTDAMASVLGNIDAVSASVGFPIRNMHTASEAGCTRDVDSAIEVLFRTLLSLNDTHRDDWRTSHVDLSTYESVASLDWSNDVEDGEEGEEGDGQKKAAPVPPQTRAFSTHARRGFSTSASPPAPARRPISGYHLFRHEKLHGSSGSEYKHLNKEIQDAWKGMSEDEKAIYRAKVDSLAPPKRPPSAYAFFVKDYSTDPAADFATNAKNAAKAWNSLADKSAYELKSAEAKKEYAQKKDAYNEKESLAKFQKEYPDFKFKVLSSAKKKRRDPNKPKRPLNGFILFCMDKRPTLTPPAGLSKAEEFKWFSTELSTAWERCSPTVRDEYAYKAQQDKERYATEIERYDAEW